MHFNIINADIRYYSLSLISSNSYINNDSDHILYKVPRLYHIFYFSCLY